ncbi:phenylalanine--tRNA ligase beta subunit-related protein [Lactobacillus sp. YT155]|uniref:B3/B4 domain-containing protein n=1 Tax=Lactobacillus sp. YT155 TaxID=3060955 RepID=UPI00265F7A7D|nr:phenylalanine--tRNA ligase beta subunit-related protein [Lactobacillus sp. YT155]MDO1605248.1 phenylalanine--tRNA ligase beta subunit-related protein [Lactobacillus sp. YT155]
MGKFTVDKKFWELFPETKITFLIAKNVDNTSYRDTPDDLLDKANQKAAKWVPDDPISENPVVKDWREAFQKFKTKKGARCAVENLLKRAKNGKGVGQINPVVDIYNSVSLNWAFPCSSEDSDKVVGDLELTVADGGEKFLPIGEAEVEEALPGEVIYKDQESVLSRCWAWRDSSRVETTETSKNLIFYMENVNPERDADHQNAIKELQSKLKDYLDIDTRVILVTKDNPEAEF